MFDIWFRPKAFYSEAAGPINMGVVIGGPEVEVDLARIAMIHVAQIAGPTSGDHWLAEPHRFQRNQA